MNDLNNKRNEMKNPNMTLKQKLVSLRFVAPDTEDLTQMSRDMRKPGFGVADQVGHKPGCTATEDG